MTKEERTSKRTVTEILGILVQVSEGVTVAQIVASSTLARSTVGKALQDLAEKGQVKSEKNGKETLWFAVAEPDLPPAEKPKRARKAATPRVRAEGDGTKLARGELRGQILAMAQGRPGEDLSPVEISKFLGGKSVGAITNALEKLSGNAESGITLSQAKPRRYQYNAVAA